MQISSVPTGLNGVKLMDRVADPQIYPSVLATAKGTGADGPELMLAVSAVFWLVAGNSLQITPENDSVGSESQGWLSVSKTQMR